MRGRIPSFFAAHFLLFVSASAQTSEEAERDQAAEVYRAVVKLCSESAFEEARKQVRQWSTSQPTSESGIYELLGMIEVYAKNYDAAESHFRRWAQLEPVSYEATFNLAESLFLQSRFKEAAEFFATSAQLAERAEENDVFELSCYKQVVSLVAARDFDAARTAGARLPEGGIAHRFSELVHLYRQGKTVKAGILLRECGELFPPTKNDLYLDSLIELGWAAQREDGTPFLVLLP